MSVISPIPNELLLEFYPHFHLTSLIVGRGVCKLWRHLIDIADIPPARHELLRLWDYLITSPSFLKTRSWTLENLKQFDRQVYIDALLAQHNDLPEDFRLWILEWPARATIDCIWPGLPGTYCDETFDRTEGYNFLGRIEVVDTITLNVGRMVEWDTPHETRPEWGTHDEEIPRSDISDDSGDDDDEPPDDLVDVPALLIRDGRDGNVWLVLDTKMKLPYAVYSAYDERYDAGGSGYTHVYSTWTSWLKTRVWDANFRAEENRPVMGCRSGAPPAARKINPWNEEYVGSRRTIAGFEPVMEQTAKQPTEGRRVA